MIQCQTSVLPEGTTKKNAVKSSAKLNFNTTIGYFWQFERMSMHMMSFFFVQWLDYYTWKLGLSSIQKCTTAFWMIVDGISVENHWWILSAW